MTYCQYCGTKLEDGQTCTCETTQAAENQQTTQNEHPTVQSAPAAPNRVTVLLKDMKAYLSAYISNPAQAVRSEVDTNSYTLSVALAVIRLLAMGLAVYGLLSTLCSDLLSGITSLTALLQSGGINIQSIAISVSLKDCFVYGTIMAASGMALFLALALILARIHHGNMPLGKIFKASATNGVLTTVLLLLSFVSTFFSLKLCVIFMALAMLSWMISGVLTASVVNQNSNSGVFWLVYFVGIVLVIVGGGYVMSSLFARAVGEITVSYAGQTIALRTVLNALETGLKGALAVGSSLPESLLGELGLSDPEVWNEIFSFLG